MASSLSKTNYVDPTLRNVSITTTQKDSPTRTTTFYNYGQQTASITEPTSTKSPSQQTQVSVLTKPGDNATGVLNGQNVSIEKDASGNARITTLQTDNQGITRAASTETLPQGKAFRGTLTDYAARTGTSISDKNFIPITGTAKEFITTARERVAPLQQPTYTIGTKEPLPYYETTPYEQATTTSTIYSTPLGYSRITKDQKIEGALIKKYPVIARSVFTGRDIITSGTTKAKEWASNQTLINDVRQGKARMTEIPFEWVQTNPAINNYITKSSNVVKNQPVLVGMVDTGTGIVNQFKEESRSGMEKATTFYSNTYMKALPSSEKANTYLSTKPTGTLFVDINNFVGSSSGKLVLGEYENVRQKPLQTGTTIVLSYGAGTVFGMGTNKVTNKLVESNTKVAKASLKTLDAGTTAMGYAWGASVGYQTVTSNNPYGTLAKSITEEAIPFGMGMQSAERIVPSRRTAYDVMNALQQEQVPSTYFTGRTKDDLYSFVKETSVLEYNKKGELIPVLSDEKVPAQYITDRTQRITGWDYESVGSGNVYLTGSSRSIGGGKQKDVSTLRYLKDGKEYFLVSETVPTYVQDAPSLRVDVLSGDVSMNKDSFGSRKDTVINAQEEIIIRPFIKRDVGSFRDIQTSKLFVKKGNDLQLIGRYENEVVPTFGLERGMQAKNKPLTLRGNEQTLEVSKATEALVVVPYEQNIFGEGTVDVLSRTSIETASGMRGKLTKHNLVFDEQKGSLDFVLTKEQPTKTTYLLKDYAEPKKVLIKQKEGALLTREPARSNVLNTQDVSAQFVVHFGKDTTSSSSISPYTKKVFRDVRFAEKERVKVNVRKEDVSTVGSSLSDVEKQIVRGLDKRNSKRQGTYDFYDFMKRTIDEKSTNPTVSAKSVSGTGTVRMKVSAKNEHVIKVQRPRVRSPESEVVKFNLPRTNMSGKEKPSLLVGAVPTHKISTDVFTNQGMSKKTKNILKEDQKLTNEQKLRMNTNVVNKQRLNQNNKVSQRLLVGTLAMSAQRQKQRLVPLTATVGVGTSKLGNFDYGGDTPLKLSKVPVTTNFVFGKSKKLGKKNNYAAEQFSRKNVYVPSLTAELLNIRGKRPSAASVASGLVIRPIVR